MKKLNLYYFGEIGAYDEFNPHYVTNKNRASEILAAIAEEEPFKLNKEEIKDKLNMDEDTLNRAITSLLKINAIEERSNGYKVNFPVFLEEDIQYLEENLKNVGEAIGENIISLKEVIYDKLKGLSIYDRFKKERLLYHIICDSIFDGTAFEFFQKKKVFAVSKEQPGGRDYIIIGYEDSEEIDKYSNNLLCSSNNYRSDSFVFNSFGDANGNRKDMYRYFRMVDQSLEKGTSFIDLNGSYMNLVNRYNKELVEECGEIIIQVLNESIKYENLSQKDKLLVDFLKDMNYLSLNKEGQVTCNVPVFGACDDKVVNEISDIILNSIVDIVLKTFSHFDNNRDSLTPVKHGVDILETANELWHQIFGAVNEYLAEVGFVEKPANIHGEGRYLRSIYCSC